MISKVILLFKADMKISDNQSLLDLAIQYSGTATVAFDLALVNGKSITEDLTVGEILTDLHISYGVESIVKYFLDNKFLPATAITDAFIDELNELGIGEMIINVNFMAKPHK